ncbi:MAG: hypothetical protein AAFV53_09325 [Myxococcota bacterium]
MLDSFLLAIIVLLPLVAIGVMLRPRERNGGSGARSGAAPLAQTHDPNMVETVDDFVAMTALGQAPPRFDPPPRGDQTFDEDDKHIVLRDDDLP